MLPTPTRLSVVLLSGGIDSTVSAVMKAREPSSAVHLLTIRYGQGAVDSEMASAYRVADWLLSSFDNVVEHFEVEISGKTRHKKSALRTVGGRIADLNIQPPTGFVGWRRPGTPSAKAGYPSTRDETFTLIAAAGAEARLRDNDFATEAEVVISTNRDDLSNYEDIFIDNYLVHLSAILARKQTSLDGRPVLISLPLIGMPKTEVLRVGIEIGAPLDLTWSCYFGVNGVPCLKCDQCVWRQQAFAEVGAKDPYQTPM